MAMQPAFACPTQWVQGSRKMRGDTGSTSANVHKCINACINANHLGEPAAAASANVEDLCNAAATSAATCCPRGNA
eukprot:366182-Chlamydomonas_euryale.AAC.11